MGRITTRRRVTRIRGDGHTVARPDTLAVEEPLEIRVGGKSLVVTMRTPGNDVELAAGFLVSEGVLTGADDLVTARYCAGTGADGANTYNVLDIVLAAHVAPPAPELARSFTTTSACGVCGKDSIDAIAIRSSFGVADDPLTISVAALLEFPARLRDHQSVFDKTGGLHAAALFDVRTCELVVVREDVGRHNAVDKVIGWALTQGLLPLRGHILQVSGRASFELVQKAVMAGIPMLSAVSAPSSLAADLADDSGLTLLGFVRGDSLVAYTRPDRLSANNVESLTSPDPS